MQAYHAAHRPPLGQPHPQDAGGDFDRHLQTGACAELLGVAIANIVTMLSIDCVVLGGGVTEALGIFSLLIAPCVNTAKFGDTA